MKYKGACSWAVFGSFPLENTCCEGDITWLVCAQRAQSYIYKDLSGITGRAKRSGRNTSIKICILLMCEWPTESLNHRLDLTRGCEFKPKVLKHKERPSGFAENEVTVSVDDSPSILVLW